MSPFIQKAFDEGQELGLSGKQYHNPYPTATACYIAFYSGYQNGYSSGLRGD